MRCKCCDKSGALAYDPPDYYCSECIEVIHRTVGSKFTLSDLYDILIPEDDREILTMVTEGGQVDE